MNQLSIRFFLLIMAVICVSSLLSAQAPQGISYQAVARNSIGAVIPNQNISLRFNIHDAAANGAVIYSETQNITTNALGLFSLFIGKGTPVTGTFAKVDWADAPKFLQVEMDVTGGTTYTDIGTQQMMSVPYAIYAENAGNGFARMSQSQIDALTPEEGTLVFNTDAHKMQVYAMLTDNVVISNEAYEGTSVSSPGGVSQTFIPPVSGHIVGIDVLVKGDPSYPFSIYGITFNAYSPGESTSQHIQVHTTALLEYTWIKGLFDLPLPIVAGSEASFNIGPSKDLIFATNNKYPDGSITYPSEARGLDLVFRIHIQPTPGSNGWQNLN